MVRGRSSIARLSALLFLSACSTQAPAQHSFYRTTQTEISLDSTPSGSASVDNKFVGTTPLTFPLEYDQEIEQDTKNVTLWETQPGLATFVTVISLGLYLPFSAIPAASQSTQVPLERYRSNQFLIAVDVPGYDRWTQQVVAKGEKNLHLQAQLVKKTTQ